MVATREESPPGSPITERLTYAVQRWTRAHFDLVSLAVDLAGSSEWITAEAPSAAHHVAGIADVEPCTAREWIRVGRRARGLPVIGRLFAEGTLSYAKVRALVSVADRDNDEELATIALGTPAGELRRELAKWLNDHSEPEEQEARHHRRRAVWWRTDADGMVTFTMRLPPAVAAVLIAVLTAIVGRSRPRPDPDGSWPTMARQNADAVEQLVTSGGAVETEVVFHVRGDGCTTDDGTPIPDSVMADLVDQSLVRALVHDANGRPVNASGRRRPSTRQRRVVKERDRSCVDCGRTDLLEFDHVPPYSETGRTDVDELQLRCAPCHRRRHEAAASGSAFPRSPD